MKKTTTRIAARATLRGGWPLALGLTLLGVGVARSDGALQERREAAEVAKKVDKAKDAKKNAHDTKEEQEALRHFQKKLSQYATLHGARLTRLTEGSAVTAQALAQAMIAARAKAKPGDILLPEVQPLFRKLLAEQLQGPDALAARKAVSEGNSSEEEGETVPVVVRVNAPYPKGAARSTVPASVLLTLPTLPECLHYRFVGRDLVLVDSVAQIIVDYMSTAVPTPGKR
jgi:hypothetical protein